MDEKLSHSIFDSLFSGEQTKEVKVFRVEGKAGFTPDYLTKDPNTMNSALDQVPDMIASTLGATDMVYWLPRITGYYIATDASAAANDEEGAWECTLSDQDDFCPPTSRV